MIPRVDVDDERHVHPAGVRLDVGQVRHPQPVRCRRLELARHEIGRPMQPVIGDGGDLERLAPSGPGQAFLAHQPLDGASSDADVLSVELCPDLVGAIDEQVLAHRPVGSPRPVPRRARARADGGRLLGDPIRVRGDLAAVLGEHSADRLDPEPVAVCVDERDYLFDWRSSSAPKKADAAFKISFARRSSRFSRSSSLIRARSSVVTPGRFAAVDLRGDGPSSATSRD